jgi:hypothetical protein
VLSLRVTWMMMMTTMMTMLMLMLRERNKSKKCHRELQVAKCGDITEKTRTTRGEILIGMPSLPPESTYWSPSKHWSAGQNK